MFRSICIFFVAALLHACATGPTIQGEDFFLQRAYYVVSGMEDAEVLALMEQPPYDRQGLGNNRETWIWTYSDDEETKTFSVLFDNNRVEATNVRVE